VIQESSVVTQVFCSTTGRSRAAPGMVQKSGSISWSMRE